MTIMDIEARSGLPRASVRFYEKEGFLTPRRTENGYRVYTPDDLALLLKIKLLRRLDIPLAEIHALHAGSAALADILETRLAEVEAEQQRRRHQKLVCDEMRTDGASYSALDAEKYLARLEGLSDVSDAFLRSDTVQQPRADYPWRRYLARSLDLNVCTLIWHVTGYLGFHWNLGRNAAAALLLDLLVAFGLMLLLEPVLLHLFAATPGKAILGIRVTNPDGDRLTLSQGYARVWAVIAQGYGYVIIPIYGLVRLYQSYRRCKERGEMAWDEELCCARSGAGRAGPVIYLLCGLALATATFLIPYAADMPQYRGELTARQFADNMNRSLRYHGIDGSVGTLPPPDDGAYAALSGAVLSLPPELRIVETDGVVTEVVMALTDTDFISLWDMPGWIYCGVNSLVGAQREMNLFTMHFGAIAAQMSGHSYYDSYRFAMAGVEVVYDVVVDGHPMSDLAYYLDHYTDTSVLTVCFTMRKT